MHITILVIFALAALQGLFFLPHQKTKSYLPLFVLASDPGILAAFGYEQRRIMKPVGGLDSGKLRLTGFWGPV